MYLPADRVIVSSERYTAGEIAQLSGVEEDFLIAARRAMGLPIPEPDEAAVHRGRARVGAHHARSPAPLGSPTTSCSDLMRVLGRSLSQVAETLRALPLKLVLEPGMSEPELASRYAQARRRAVSAGRSAAGRACSRCICRHATQSTVVSALERSGGQLPGSREVTVVLRGPRRLHAPGRGSRAGSSSGAWRSAWKSSPATSPSHRSRLVKTIGDAAMQASPQPEPLLNAALRLIDAADAGGEDFPQLRAGAALGQALPRAARLVEPPVNLASRITAVARPSSLLVERELRESVARPPTRWSFAGERRLKRHPRPACRCTAPGATSSRRSAGDPLEDLAGDVEVGVHRVDVVVVLERLDQAHQACRAGPPRSSTTRRRALDHLGALDLDAGVLERRAPR